jgi:predicted nucleic acid-binding protein
VLSDRLHVCAPFRLEARYSARTTEDFLALSEDLEGFHRADADSETWLLTERAQRDLAKDPAVSHRVKLADLWLRLSLPDTALAFCTTTPTTT